MSNRIYFEPTKFTNVRHGGVSFGYRAYDDYGQSYDNTWEVIPDDDIEFLKKIIDCNDELVGAMLDFAQENQQGVYVSGNFIEWAELHPLLVRVGRADADTSAPGVITQ
jgi:hypothetical protein